MEWLERGMRLAYFVIFLYLTWMSVKKAPKNEWYEDGLDLKYTKAMQGIFALGIMLHHVDIILKEYPDYNNGLIFFREAGVLHVGFFFFCSGYGLFYQLANKKDYLRTFITRRICTVLVPFFLCNYLFTFVLQLMGHKFSIREILECFFGLRLTNSQMWFAVEIMIIYLAFWLIFRHFREEKIKTGYVLMTLFVVALIIIGIFSGHEAFDARSSRWFKGEWWYNTTPMFLVGMYVSINRERCKQFVKKWYSLLVVLSAVTSAAFLLIFELRGGSDGYWTEVHGVTYSQCIIDRVVTMLIEFPSVFLFTMLVCLLMLKFKFYNRLHAFLGKISLEILLLNNLALQTLCVFNYRMPVILFTLLSIAITIPLAYVLYRIKCIVFEKKAE